MSYIDLTEGELARRLAAAAPALCSPDAPRPAPYPAEFLSPSGDPPRPAAVLVPFLRLSGEWHVLYTRRTNTLPEHSGQVAFPGGRMDPGDVSPEATALREASEEIGLPGEQVRLIGRTDSFVTITNYCVTPVVGVIPWPFSIRLAMNEVDRVFTIPLSWLAEPGHHEVSLRSLPPPYPAVKVIYFQRYDGELLWGVSAEITLNLLELLFGETKP